MNNNNTSYDNTQNTIVDSTRGKLLTDVQMSADSKPMTSTSFPIALNDKTTHDITSILERPVNLGTFVWKSSDQALDILFPRNSYIGNKTNYLRKLAFPQDIFDKSTLATDKLKNFQYMRADVEVEIKVNAQPFLQGALLLVYNPYYTNINKFRRVGTRFLASQTSCPHKIISLEEGNSLKLVCPYANIYDLFDLGNSKNQFGTCFLYVLSPLTGATADAEVHYTIFARLINPKFYVPTSNNVLSEAVEQHAKNMLTEKGYTVSKAQSSTGPVETNEGNIDRPVSTIANAVTTVADTLSGVPVIGEIASGVGWVSRMVSNVASVFGLSKAVQTKATQKVVIKTAATMPHSEGSDDATTLALIQDNSIDASTMIPENIDEMALKYIFGRPNYFSSKTVKADTFTGDNLLHKWEVSPFSTYQYGELMDSETLYFGSFAYASMMGTLWRGEINYDITVIKTPFHQGRFAVVFLPETTLDKVPDKLGSMLNTNYNVVCNLKDRQDELGRVTFRASVPFVSNTPWRKTYHSKKNKPDASTLLTSTGCLAIYSLVDLSYPPTVADSISFFIAHSGGEDYQIARPSIQVAPGWQSQYPKLYAQSDTGSVEIPADENLLIPSSSTFDASPSTTGEYFKSLKALAQRFGYVFNLLSSNTYTGLLPRSFFEDSYSGQRSFTVLDNIDNEPYALSPFYMISFLYRFYAGSSSHKYIATDPNSTGFAYLDYDSLNTYIVRSGSEGPCGKAILTQQMMSNNALEVRVPHYHGVRCAVVGGKNRDLLEAPRLFVKMYTQSDKKTNNPVFEAAGQDFQFFFLVGPPPMSDIGNFKGLASLPFSSEVFFTGGQTGLTADSTDNYIYVEGVDTYPLLKQTYTSVPILSSKDVLTFKHGGKDYEIAIVMCRIDHSLGKTTVYFPKDALPKDIEPKELSDIFSGKPKEFYISSKYVNKFL